MATLTLVRIVAPHFVAGVVARDGTIVRAAPIVRYMIGWDGTRLATYLRSRGWQWTVVASPMLDELVAEAETEAEAGYDVDWLIRRRGRRTPPFPTQDQREP